MEMQVSLQCMLEKITYMEDRIRALSHVRGRWLQQQMEQEEVKHQMEQWKLLKNYPAKVFDKSNANPWKMQGQCNEII